MRLGTPWTILGCTILALLAESSPALEQIPLSHRSKPVLTIAGRQFRDLNGNGVLDPYEDWRLSPAQRADDLLSRLTLADKAGLLLHGTAPPLGGITSATLRARYDFDVAATLIQQRHVVTMTTREEAPPPVLAEENNHLQELAESTPLGIPVTLSTDPRHHFQSVAGASQTSKGFSQWPEPLGLAAIGDAVLTRRFGDIARQEYRAVGIHQALSPMADLASEPRWPRYAGTFGEDPALSERMVRAYVAGFQGGDTGVTPQGVSAVVKHWVGYGAAAGGFDSHNAYGRYSTVTASSLPAHVQPFLGAFAVGVAGVMPTYSVLSSLAVDGHPPSAVGAGFDRWLLTDLLRDRYHFGGVVVSDWAIVNDCDRTCREGFAPGVAPTMSNFSTAWGLEDLTAPQRIGKALDAGIDQLGGIDDPAALIQAIQEGLVTEARVNASVRRVLLLKFRQGLFENPYVDAAAAASIAGSASFVQEGLRAQSRSLVLLAHRRGLLPLHKKKVFLAGFAPDAATRAGLTVVDDLKAADIAIVKLETPFETLHPNYVFGLRQHEGSLEFRHDDAGLHQVRAARELGIPVAAIVHLDRPAILTPLKESADVLIGDFGVSDQALFDVLTGKRKPQGRLPMELPASMQAVDAQKADVPHDSAQPLYPLGAGLRLP